MTDPQSKDGRMVLFRNNFLPYSETFIHDQIRHHERYSVTVCARQQRNLERFGGHNVVAVEQLPDNPRPIPSAVYAATGWSAEIDHTMRSGDFDIVHAHFGHNGLYAMRYATKYNVPMVVSLHGRDVSVLVGRDKYTPAWWHYAIGSKILFKRTALFLAASQELADLIVACGCPPEKVTVYRLGIDIDNFSPGTPPPQEAAARVVMVGRFVAKKGHQTGIRAVAQAIKAGHRVQLIIIGDGPLKETYDQLIDELDIRDSVHYTGALPHNEVVATLRTATALLAPSVVAKNQDRESGLIVAKEAAACALPVIGSYHGGIPEIIDDGTTGFLVPEHDHQAMGQRLTTLLGDRDLRLKMGQAARAKMESEYNIVERVRVLESLYDEVIAEHGQQAR